MQCNGFKCSHKAHNVVQAHTSTNTHTLAQVDRQRKTIKKIEFKFSLMQLHLLQSTSIRIGRNLEKKYPRRQRGANEKERKVMLTEKSITHRKCTVHNTDEIKTE